MESKNQPEWDAIIVGLGCVGIGAAYNLSKQGMKVLGFEKHPDSGCIGTASYGHTRIWRTSHDDERYNKMQAEALELWREIEKKSGKEIILTTGMLWVVRDGSELLEFLRTHGAGEKLSRDEMIKRYPALIAMPQDFVGYFHYEAGIVRSRVGIQATKELSIQQGADLRYGKSVKNVDIKAGIVTLENGETYHAKNVVICCGPVTDQFYDKGAFEMNYIPQETWVINNNKDLPPVMIISGISDFLNYDIYSLRDGENMEHFKFGHEYGAYDSKIMMGLLKKYLPTKYYDLIHVQPCCYSRTPGEEFIFEKRDKAVYAFGLSGKGFKHMPYHGKRILHLINGHVEEADKYKLKGTKKEVKK